MTSEVEEVDVPYVWLSDDEWKHTMFTTRGQVGAILNPLRLYGQGVYVDGAIEELMKLFDLFSQRVRGKDIDIAFLDKPRPLPTE